MHIKVGDTVQVLSGEGANEKVKGKRKYLTGTVQKVIPDDNRIIVQGVNIITRHTKPRKQGESGGRIEKEAPIDASRAMPVCPHCKKPVRIGYLPKAPGQKNKIRICCKCKNPLDKQAK